MALIANNISGSASNSSRIGITGSVIFANQPGSSFPSFPNPTVTFFVSGSSTVAGADNPSIVFKGDTFASGAFGVNEYIQMKPVGSLRIPTNTSASYIYTSGSTNDLYFTQYSPGFTNTTRLRWLESVSSTGLLHGGILSTQNGTTTFSITSGSALIVMPNASTTRDPYPTMQLVTWPSYVSQSLTYVATNQITYVGINQNGGIIQQTTPFTNGDYLDYINLGRILHMSGSVTTTAITAPSTAYSVPQQLSHFSRAFGSLKISGHVLAASGSTLSLIKTAGDSYAEGRNYTVDPDDPNYVRAISDTAVTVSKIYREYVSGSTMIIDVGVANEGFTVVDPTKYNNNGTLANVTAAQFTIQRVYWFPNSVDRAFYVYYGNAPYLSLDLAEAAIPSEIFTEGDNTKNGAIYVAALLVKGNASDLSNTTQARFVQGGLFRSITSTGGGGATAVTPGGLDTYVQFNDGGSTFGGDAEFTYNKTTNILTIGDVSIGDSGLISTSNTTANVFNTNSTTVNFAGAATTVEIGAATGTTSVNNSLTVDGKLTVTGGTTAVTDAVLGNAAVGSFPFYDGGASAGVYAMFGHKDLDHSTAITNYALYQDNVGNTVVNASNDKTLFLSVNNTAMGFITNNLLGTGIDAISLTGQSSTKTNMALGNDTSDSSTTIYAGTGGMLLTGAIGTAYTIGGQGGTGTITVGRSIDDNTVNIATGTTAAGKIQTVNIATSATSTGFSRVSIGNSNGSTAVTVTGGASISLTGAAATTYSVGTTTTSGGITIGQSTATSNTISVGSSITAGSAGTQTINVGTGTGRNIITVGSNGSNGSGQGSSLSLVAGTEHMTFTGATTTNYTMGTTTGTGTITIGQSTAGNTIEIGSGATTSTQTINVGNNTGTTGNTIISIASSSLGTKKVYIGRNGGIGYFFGSGTGSEVYVNGNIIKIGDNVGSWPAAITLSGSINCIGLTTTDSDLFAGSAELGSFPAWTPDPSAFAMFGHKTLSHSSIGNYALLQSSVGATSINAASGQTLYLRNNNTDLASLTSGITSITGASNVATTTTIGNTTGASSTTIQAGTGDIVMAATVRNSSQPSFLATLSAAQNNFATSTDVTVLFDTEIYDNANNFAVGSYTFTAPETGKYLFNVALRLDNIDTAADYYTLYLITSNRNYRLSLIDPGHFAADPVYWYLNGSAIADMDSTDTAYVVIRQQVGTSQTDILNGTANSFFSGWFLG